MEEVSEPPLFDKPAERERLVGSLGIRVSRPTGMTEPGPNIFSFCGESVAGRRNVSGHSGGFPEAMNEVVWCGMSSFALPVGVPHPAGPRFCCPALLHQRGAEGTKFIPRGPPKLPPIVVGNGVMEVSF